MIFNVNLTISLIMLALVILYSIRNKSFYNPHLFYWGVTLYAVLLPARTYYPEIVRDELYNMLYLFSSLGAIAAFFLIPIKPEVALSNNKAKAQLHPIIVVLAMIYLCNLLYSIFSIVYASGGFINALVISRLDIYLKQGIMSGQSISKIFMMLPEACLFILIGFLIHNRKLLASTTIVTILVTFYIFTSNTRLPILFPLIAYYVVLARVFFPQHIRKLIPLSIVGGLVFVIAFSVVGSYLRNGQIESLNLSQEMIIEEASSRSSNQLGYYKWVYDLYNKLQEGDMSYGYGVEFFLNPVTSFIPRIFWPQKPLTSSSNLLTEKVYEQRKIGDGEPIHTFLLIGEGFWQFSWLGAFILPFLFIFLVTFVAKKIANLPYSFYWQAYFIISCMPFVRAEMPLVKSLLILILVYVISTISKTTISFRNPKVAGSDNYILSKT